MTMVNCTLTGNSATGSSSGGAIRNQGQLEIINCTLVGNSAANAAGGIDNLASVYLTNSIVCSNTATTGNPNIVGTIYLYSAANLVDTDPLLAPLGNYGGPTQTMPPLSGSPAIDAGNDSAAGGLTFDQRGLPRFSGAHVDIGAVEIQPPAIISTNPVVITGAAKLGNGTFQFGFTNQTGGNFTVFASTNLALPINAWSNLGAPVESPAGSYKFTDPQATNYPQRYYRVRSP
jgi:hypothetical protein